MEKEPTKPWWQAGITVFAEVTGWIAAPIIGALYLGKYLDRAFDSEPWYFLSLTGMAFVVSTIGITITAGKYISKIEQENKLNNKANKDKDPESGSGDKKENGNS